MCVAFGPKRTEDLTLSESEYAMRFMLGEPSAVECILATPTLTSNSGITLYLLASTTRIVEHVDRRQSPYNGYVMSIEMRPGRYDLCCCSQCASDEAQQART